MYPLLDIDQLHTLVTIAETGSFTKAAEEVEKTQSAVSMQMKRLEEVVGKPIFAKDGRAAKLTDEGLRLVDYGRRILQLNSEALNDITKKEIGGKVRLGTPDDYADRFLPAILARFARSNPKVEVSVTCEPTPMLLKQLEDHTLDLAIVTRTDYTPTAKIFRRERLLWVVSDRHNAWQEDVVPLAVGHHICEWRKAGTRALDQVNKRFRVAYTSWNSSALIAAVHSGLAVGILPESCVKAGMRVLTLEDGFPDLPSCDVAVIHASGQLSPGAQALEQHIMTTLDNIAPRALAAE